MNLKFRSIVFAIYSAIAYVGFHIGTALAANASTETQLKRQDTFKNWQYAVGVVTPVILEFLLQSHWSRRMQAAISFVFCFGAAFIGEWVIGNFDVGDVFGSTLKIVMVTMPVYYGFVQHLGIKAKTDLPATPAA